MQLTDADLRAVLERSFGDQHYGHSHFWERAALSRRQFMGAAAATGAAVGASVLTPLTAVGDASTTAAPNPIPPNPALGGLRVWLPGKTNEPSTIYDFNGFVGVAAIEGTGTGTEGPGLTFDADQRFMDGVFVGSDGAIHHGTFGFV
jgi:hypothetical protein